MHSNRKKILRSELLGSAQLSFQQLTPRKLVFSPSCTSRVIKSLGHGSAVIIGYILVTTNDKPKTTLVGTIHARVSSSIILSMMKNRNRLVDISIPNIHSIQDVLGLHHFFFR